MTRGNEAQRDQRREEQNQTSAPSSSRPTSIIDNNNNNNTNTMDRNVRARVDQIFNSLIENVNEDARAGIASYIAQLARDTASGNKKQQQAKERLQEYAEKIRQSQGVEDGADDDDNITATNKKKTMTSTKIMKVPQKVEPKWREYATEEQLREFLNANDVPYDRAETWTRKMLLERCEQHLAKVSEPASKIRNELIRVSEAFEAWMHAVGKKNANETFEEGEEENDTILSSSMPKLASSNTASAILEELRACEHQANEHLSYIKNRLDPFKLMQYPACGCSILDLAYIHVDFSNRVMLGLFPILKAASNVSFTIWVRKDVTRKRKPAARRNHGRT